MKKQKTITAWGVWLGFMRKSDKKFYWIDDTPLEGHYSPWSSGQPNNPNSEYCGNMFGTGSGQGKWNDLYCSLTEAQLKYAPSILCQKKFNWAKEGAISFLYFAYKHTLTIKRFARVNWGISLYYTCNIQQVIHLIPDYYFSCCVNEVKWK